MVATSPSRMTAPSRSATISPWNDATLASVYDLLAAGRPWHEAFSAEELPAALHAT